MQCGLPLTPSRAKATDAIDRAYSNPGIIETGMQTNYDLTAASLRRMRAAYDQLISAASRRRRIRLLEEALRIERQSYDATLKSLELNGLTVAILEKLLRDPVHHGYRNAPGAAPINGGRAAARLKQSSWPLQHARRSVCG